MSTAAIIVGVVSAVVLLILAEVTKALFVTEAQTRLERLPLAILRLAGRRLGARHRTAIYRDEWLPEMEFIARETGGLPITRLLRSTWFAIGLLWSARAISVARGGLADDPTGGAVNATNEASVDPASLNSFQYTAVQAISTVLARDPGPSVLSIEGPWGSGKSSVLAHVQHVGTETASGSFITISFNAWHREHELTPTVGMVDVIESAVAEARWQSDSQTRRPRRRRRPTAGRHRRRSRELQRVFGSSVSTRALGRCPAVVLVDDLDRCRPDTVLETLRAVHLLTSDAQNGIRFVLTYDPDWIVTCLDRAVAVIGDPSGAPSTPETGRVFLEKLVGVQVRLPEGLRPPPLAPGMETDLPRTRDQ